jgi:hypothetical protein
MTDMRLDTMRALAAGTALAIAAAGAAPAGARADDPEPEVSDQSGGLWNRLLSIEVTGAIDGPLGVAGGSLVISPVQWLGLEIGGGVSRDGGRVAGGARIVLPQDHFALILRLGISAGPQEWDGTAQQATTAYTVRRRWEFQAAMYADVGLQYRFDMGLYLMLNGGVESGFSNHADTCRALDAPVGTDPSRCDLESGGHPARVYLGLTLGYAFDITI